MSQPIDFANYQELMMANAQMKKNGQPQLYQVAPMSNMVPGIFPIPIISMRPNTDFDYRGWVAADGTYVDASAYVAARPAYEAVPGAPPQLAVPAAKPSSSRPSSPLLEGGSPRFGPGPPIVTSERVKGPRGCNLFVFHLPNEITNWDLYLLFRRFGTILSVHTMVNKATGLSKGFGFVSYSAPQEATNAITEMDGFRLGKKRLKVQLKRSQDDNPDEDELDVEGDENSSYYPSNGYEDGVAAATAPPRSNRSFEGGRSRQNSFNSTYSNENGAGSGNTTRASTPYGQPPTHHYSQIHQHHHQQVQQPPPKSESGGSGSSDSGGYYQGVDSTPHSPTPLEDNSGGGGSININRAAAAVEAQVLPQMNNLSLHRGETRSNQSSSSSSGSYGGSKGSSGSSGRVPRGV